MVQWYRRICGGIGVYAVVQSYRQWYRCIYIKGGSHTNPYITGRVYKIFSGYPDYNM